uniref:Phytocyanin domain-containing protein n=1 Tax=Ditylum brightwellii TaxID=49249 RepID=A0A6S8YB97_9STRA|mmetsp:Transcript_9474/g.13946  ORF Transcript_9474/g.13946 Transcript_9474/m.13946 type:complete len:162 (+) Transcript_9474:189-674(+)
MKYFASLQLLGMLASLFASYAEGADEIVIDWFIKSYKDLPAKVGDSVRFEFTNNHNVYIHPSGTCDETDSVALDIMSGSAFNTASYTFVEDDVGAKTFACQVSSHCGSGQILTFNVASADNNTEAPEELEAPETSSGEFLSLSKGLVSLIVSVSLISFHLF